jgi:lipid-binding SYLF domain-containing protein
MSARRGLPWLMRALLLALVLAGPAQAQRPAEQQQVLVDRATLTVQEMMADGDPQAAEDARSLLRRARAVMICPQVFRAGFIFGGQGGDCVMVARDAAGSWSSPAFYGLASGSVGLQIGMQNMQILMLVMNDRALTALMDSQFKFGADASISVAAVGAGIAGATTSAAGADIVAIARARGLFAGVALEGSLMSARSDWNRAYYGQDVGARQIVVAMEVHNPGADPLRAALMRHGAAAGSPMPQPAEPPPGAPPATMQPAYPQSGGVQSSPLPPIAGPR